MPIETIDEFEIEYEAQHLPDDEGWAAYVTIYGPSSNPMHRNGIYPTHRVATDVFFPSEQAAEEEALKIGRQLLAGHHARHI